MSKYKKKNSLPFVLVLLIVVAALLFVSAAGTSLLSAVGRGNTPSGGNSSKPPSGGEDDDCSHEQKASRLIEQPGTSTHIIVIVCHNCDFEFSRTVSNCNYGGGRYCMICGVICPHSSTMIVYNNLSDTQHNKVTACGVCGTGISSVSEDHTFVNDVCTLCNYNRAGGGNTGTELPPVTDEDGNCLHANVKPGGQYSNSYRCYQWYECVSCGMRVAANGISINEYLSHVYDNMTCIHCGYVCEHLGMEEGDICTYCGYGCAHAETSYDSCTPITQISHKEYYKCAACGQSVSFAVPCTFENGVCKICGNICPHYSVDVTYESVNNTQHSKIETCTLCKEQTDSALYAHTFLNGVCTVCGRVCSHNYIDAVCEYCSDVECLHTLTYSYDNSGGVYSYTQECACGKMNATKTNEQDYLSVFFGSGNAMDFSFTYTIGMTWADLINSGACQYLYVTVIIDGIKVVGCSYPGSHHVMLNGDFVHPDDYILLDAKYVTDTYNTYK